MSGNSIIHDVDFVNEQIDTLKIKSENFDIIAKSLSDGIGNILGLRGASDVCENLSASKYSGKIEECRAAVDFAINQIRTVQLALIKLSNSEEDLQKFLSGVTAEEWKKLGYSEENIPKNIDELQSNCPTISEAIATVGGNTETTLWTGIKTLGISFIEGIGEFGETGVDLVVTAGGTLWAGINFVFQGSAKANEIMDETKAFVSDKKVQNAFDEWTDNGVFGEDVKTYKYINPESYNLVRGIGNGLGYSTAMIFTGKVIGGALTPTGATPQQASAIMGKVLRRTAGVLGTSSNTEEAWANGAGTLEGLGEGVAGGIWEGVQWGAGVKLNNWASQGGAIRSAANVALDTAFGAAEGYVRPGIDAMGTALTMDRGDLTVMQAFDQEFDAAFEAAGGTQNVIKNAAVSGIMSGTAEVAPTAFKAAGNTKLGQGIKNLFTSNNAPTPTNSLNPSTSTFTDSYGRTTTTTEFELNGKNIREVTGPTGTTTRVTTETNHNQTIQTVQRLDSSGNPVGNGRKIVETDLGNGKTHREITDSSGAVTSQTITKTDTRSGYKYETNTTLPSGQTTNRVEVIKTTSDTNGNTVTTRDISLTNADGTTSNIKLKDTMDGNGAKLASSITQIAGNGKVEGKVTYGNDGTIVTSKEIKNFTNGTLDTLETVTYNIASGQKLSVVTDSNGQFVRSTNVTANQDGTFNKTVTTAPVPTSTVPTSTVPTSTVPTSTVPTSTVPTSTVPTSTVPTSTVPTSTVPTSTVPTSTVPTSTVPTSTVPTSTVPTSTVPTSTTPTAQSFVDAYGRKTTIVDDGVSATGGTKNTQIVTGPTGEKTRVITETTTLANGLLETTKTIQKLDAGGSPTGNARTIIDTDLGNNQHKIVTTDTTGKTITQTVTTDPTTGKKTTVTDLGNGKKNTREELITTTSDNGKTTTTKDIKITDANGKQSNIQLKDTTVDGTETANRSYSNKFDRRTESSMSYTRKGEQAITSEIIYDADGSVKNKDINTTTSIKNKKGTDVLETTRKEVEYKTNSDGNGRKVTREFGPDGGEQVTVKIKDANADGTFKATQEATHTRIRDIAKRISEGKGLTGKVAAVGNALAERGGSKLATWGDLHKNSIGAKISGQPGLVASGYDDLVERYIREQAIATGKLPSELRADTKIMADADKYAKSLLHTRSLSEGVRNTHEDAIARNLENRLDNPAGFVKKAALAAFDVASVPLVMTAGATIANLFDGKEKVEQPSSSTPPDTTAVPPTDPYIPPGGGPSGDDGGGGGPSEDTTPSDEITDPSDVTPNEAPVSTTATPEQPETLPPEEEVITGITDNQPTTGGGNNWGQTGGGQSFDEEIQDDLTDEETLLGDENLDDLDTEDVYTIPMASDGSYSSVTKDGVNPVPILAGLGLVAAAGVGAKIYMDNKKNNENIDDDEFMDDSEFEEFSSTDSDLIADEWTDETLGEDMAETDADYERPSFYSDTLGDEI